jgi:succinate dehydrogenase flavin-adding protein (antitoxin of CptAB toxin-antitoxin module)
MADSVLVENWDWNWSLETLIETTQHRCDVTLLWKELLNVLLLQENPDLWQWLTGQAEPPSDLVANTVSNLSFFS